MRTYTTEEKEQIVNSCPTLGGLINKLGLQRVTGKDRKTALKKYKAFMYNDQDGDGYFKVPVYKYEGIYYCSI